MTTRRRDYGDGSVYQRKDGRYVASVRWEDDQGKARRTSAYGRTEQEAKRRLKALRQRAAAGQPLTESRATLTDYAARWESHTLAAADLKPTTKQTYSTLVRSTVLPGLGTYRLGDLKPSDVERWLVTVQTAGKSASTRRQALAILAMILDAAERDGLVRRNVARMVDRPRKPTTEADWWTSKQVTTLIAAAKGQRLAPLLTLVAYTGLRRGEALALRWSDVDLKTGTVTVTGTLARVGTELFRQDTKTTAGRRVVPLVPEAVRALKAQRKAQAAEQLRAGTAWTSTGYVFTTEIGTPVDPRNALRWFYVIRDKAKLESGSWHTLRHSCASVLLTSGVPMPIVSAVLGHSSISITVDTYGHLAAPIMADAMRGALVGYGKDRRK